MIAPLRTLRPCLRHHGGAGRLQEAGTAAAPPPEVSVVEAKPQTLPLQRELVGRLSGFRNRSTWRARVAGVLLKRLYTEGTDVKEGQPLFQIDPAPLKATLAAA